MGHWAFLPVRDKHFELQKSWVPVKSFKIHDVAHKKSLLKFFCGRRFFASFFNPVLQAFSGLFPLSSQLPIPSILRCG